MESLFNLLEMKRKKAEKGCIRIKITVEKEQAVDSSSLKLSPNNATDTAKQPLDY